VDWFYGFKLHLVVNDCGELLAVKITAGNVDDRNPVLELASTLSGKLFGDRGYISQKLFEQLWERHVQLITKLRNMKNKLLPLFDKRLLRKRSLVETINDQRATVWKNDSPLTSRLARARPKPPLILPLRWCVAPKRSSSSCRL
jgi:Transposase DDE domain